MIALAPYNFEGSSVRALEIDGEPYFVGKDVAEALGYANASDAIATHCKGVAKRYPLQTGGGVQEVRVISEPDMLRLIVNSTLQAAERFERWVFEEVLPSIRKTGRYATPARSQDTSRVRAWLLLMKAVTGVPGVKPELAMTVTLDAIERDTGLPATSLRLALPGAKVDEAKKFNPTQLGTRIGKSAKAVNLALVTLGLQIKTARDNAVTEAGIKHGEMVPFTRHGHSGYQPLWYESVLPLLEQHFATRSNVVSLEAAG